MSLWPLSSSSLLLNPRSFQPLRTSQSTRHALSIGGETKVFCFAYLNSTLCRMMSMASNALEQAHDHVHSHQLEGAHGETSSAIPRSLTTGAMSDGMCQEISVSSSALCIVESNASNTKERMNVHLGSSLRQQQSATSELQTTDVLMLVVMAMGLSIAVLQWRWRWRIQRISKTSPEAWASSRGFPSRQSPLECIKMEGLFRLHERMINSFFRRPSPMQDSEAWRRKQDFLQRNGHNYGYGDSAKGFIDAWRHHEFPTLIHPLGIKASATEALHTEREVYLDYAGAALVSKSQWVSTHDIFLPDPRHRHHQILANPHSTGPAASRTSVMIEQAKQDVLRFLNATPGKHAYLRNDNPTANDADHHSGYDVIFTSGTTDALRLIAERFRWNRSSTFMYAQNSHTSVVGMRGSAIAHGARYECVPMGQIAASMSRIDEPEQHAHQGTSREDGQPKNSDSDTTPHLVAVPLECNFGSGAIPDLAQMKEQRCRARRNDSSRWAILLDVAKAAATSPIHLRELDPDFACLSFYKLFGAPTGLGALLIKKGSERMLQTESSYFGGGSVDMVLANQNYVVPRPIQSSMTNGTCHFHGIASLQFGFEEIRRLGGMECVASHVQSLSNEFAKRLRALRHGSDVAVVQLYGEWESSNETCAGSSIVTFNVRRSDGSFVGYNEVAKLAQLQNPPIQFRTGCFCNAGACQAALEWTDDELIANHQVNGHVCGDHMDLIHARPTGAIRVSFGKDSLWEDMDALVEFLRRHFVDDMPALAQAPSRALAPQIATIRKLYIFPIKSCASQRVSRWQVSQPSGRLLYDREFAFVDTAGIAMRLQRYPKMALIQPRIDLRTMTMTLSAPGMRDVAVDLRSSQTQLDAVSEQVVSVCGNKCSGRAWGTVEVSRWITEFLGVPCFLARYGMQKQPLQQLTRDATVAFANEQPILLLTENAVSTLNQVLADQGQSGVDSKQFRGNIVVGIDNPNTNTSIQTEEDSWRRIEVRNRTQPSLTTATTVAGGTAAALVSSKLQFDVVGECARCAMVDYDPVTGRRGRTLRALAKYRRRNGQITFGLFLRTRSCDSSQAAHRWIEEGDGLVCHSDHSPATER